MFQPYFHDGNFVLYWGDSIQIMSWLPENSIDMIFADPPYFLSNWWYAVSWWKRVKVNKWSWDKSQWVENDLLFHRKWIQEARRILKPNGTIWISWTYHNIYQCGYLLQELNFHILNDICWFKPNASPNLSCRFFTASHETIIWARKDKKSKHYFDYQAMKNWDWDSDALKKPWLQMRSVWSAYPPKKSEKFYWKHPTQKPIELLRRIILASTKEWDTILDPFSGSSTTGIIANQLKRSFIGIEQEIKYLNLSILRYSNQEHPE